MILTDNVHLISDACVINGQNEKELFKFSMKIGLEYSWLQWENIIHFNLFGVKIDEAIKAGATVVTSRELIKRYRRNNPK
jgi:hypothetical protein